MLGAAALGATAGLVVGGVIPAPAWGPDWLGSPAHASARASTGAASGGAVELAHAVAAGGAAVLDAPTPLAPALVPPMGTFEGVVDEALLAPLRTAKPVKVKLNRGGSSLSLRIDFADGSRAAFKPDQIHLQTIPRKEVAAYRLSRLLGLTAVPPAIARRFSQEELLGAVDPRMPEARARVLAEITWSADGTVAGELSSWIPKIEDATVDDVEIDTVDGMVRWKRYLAQGGEAPPEDAALLQQMSTMIAFDFLTNNVDRWSGNNAKTSPDGVILYFMDNTLAFGARGGHRKTQNYLERVQKFSRSFRWALGRLDRAAVERAMTDDPGPYPALLTPEELDALFVRRQVLLDHIDGLVATHGDPAVLVYP